MSIQRQRILLIDDDEDDYILIRKTISQTRGSHFDLTWAPTYDTGLDKFASDEFAAILIDYSLGSHTGLDFIHEATLRNSQIPIILLTGQGSYDIDLQAMKAGAADYLTKDEVSAPLLERSIRYAIERKQTEIKLRKEATRYGLLADLSRDFAEMAFDDQNLFFSIAQRVMEVMGDAVLIRILSEDGATLDPVNIFHTDPQIRQAWEEMMEGLPQRVDEGLEGEVAQTREAKLVHADSPEEWVRLTRPEFKPWLERDPVENMYIVPLSAQSKLIGTMLVVRYKKVGPITPEDQQFYLDLANRAAMAIEISYLYKELQQMAVTDSLTGLFNRRGFSQLGVREMERRLRQNRPLSAIMLDIDHFKMVNDVHGHTFGDEVLIALSRACAANIRKTDIAARFGGDEVIILLPDADLTTANHIAGRIRECFARQEFTSKGNLVQFTVSLGVAEAQPEMRHVDELIRLADQALYQAKRGGRNRVES